MCHNVPRIGYKIPYNKSIQTSLNKMDTRKGLSIEVSNSQYDFLYEVLMEAYSNDVAEQKGWDVQTFDNLVDNVCDAQQTYLESRVHGIPKRAS